jgi:hypothetical protein
MIDVSMSVDPTREPVDAFKAPPCCTNFPMPDLVPGAWASMGGQSR